LLKAPPTSPYGISAGTASTSSNTIRLSFTGALDGSAVTNPALYEVQVDGIRVAVETVVHTTSSTIVITVPAGSLRKGARVKVLWEQLRDAQGRTVAIGSWQGTAG
jgi:hypothetical protein